MITRHRLTVRCACPVDKGPDTYAVVVETTRCIPVEAILKLAGSFVRRRMYQEDVTNTLARELGARVVTTGQHSGVITECEAGTA